MEEQTTNPIPQPIPFKAETRQLLDILIHSLYTERDVFLRELISNASDACSRMSFEMLTNRDVLDGDVELGIWITTDAEAGTLTIRDSGVGMTAREMEENLGTIAHSGAGAFLKAARDQQDQLNDVIGQFGVGFYSAFMVAEWIRVFSRSFKPDEAAAEWFSTGEDNFTIRPAEKANRGTEVIIKLKPDALDYTQAGYLNNIIHRHSDYIPYPIYIGDSPEQVNHQTALWRQQPRDIAPEQYNQFYRQFTLDSQEPFLHVHIATDAPVQIYSVLYIPASQDRNMLGARRKDGLALYARKVLIQEYHQGLLPDFFRFVQGVVDSEDIPLNVSRESVQSTRLMVQIKKVITTRLIDALKVLAKDHPDQYSSLWDEYGHYIKEGVATEAEFSTSLLPLLRFHSRLGASTWLSLDDYVAASHPSQKKIYYLLGDDEHAMAASPHLDAFLKQNVDVLFFSDPVDAFMLLRTNQYLDYELINAAAEAPNGSDETDVPSDDQSGQSIEGDISFLIERMRNQLGIRVSDVRTTNRLIDSPARVIDPQGAPGQEMQQVFRLLNQTFQSPPKVLEINPHHPLIIGLSGLAEDNPLGNLLIEQIFDNARMVEGMELDPATVISRTQAIMEAALKKDKP